MGGTERGAEAINGIVALPYMVLAIGTAMGRIPWVLAVASFASLPWAMELADYVTRNHSVPNVIRYAKLVAIKWHCAMTVALSGGLATLRLVPDIPFLPAGV